MGSWGRLSGEVNDSTGLAAGLARDPAEYVSFQIPNTLSISQGFGFTLFLNKSTIYHTLVREDPSMNSIITADELKTKGISIIDHLTETRDEMLITVQGKEKYVIMKIEKYNRLRELELKSAVEEARADYNAGRTHPDSIEAHLQRLKDV